MTSTKVASMLTRCVMIICAMAIATVSQSADERGETPHETVSARPAEWVTNADRRLLLGLAAAGDTLVAVGERGNIVTSTDGITWHQQAVPANATLTAVTFANARSGWAAGHDATILHTTDQGKTWQLQSFMPEPSRPVLNLLALDTEHVYAVGAYGLFLETLDGGNHWQEVDAPTVRQDELHLHSLTRLNDGDLFVAGEQGLLAVRDAAGTWTKLPSIYKGSFFGALPWGDHGAIVFGLRGTIYHTRDVRSERWVPVDAHTTASLFGGSILKDRGALLVGADHYSALIRPDGEVQVMSSAVGAANATIASAISWHEKIVAVGESGVTFLHGAGLACSHCSER